MNQMKINYQRTRLNSFPHISIFNFCFSFAFFIKGAERRVLWTLKCHKTFYSNFSSLSTLPACQPPTVFEKYLTSPRLRFSFSVFPLSVRCFFLFHLFSLSSLVVGLVEGVLCVGGCAWFWV